VRARLHRSAHARCMARQMTPLRWLAGDEEGMESLSGPQRIRMSRWSASAHTGRGGRQQGAELTMHGGGAVTVADGEVRAVFDVDLHYREMVRSMLQHEKRKRRKLTC
jgi:hypothetical protein